MKIESNINFKSGTTRINSQNNQRYLSNSMSNRDFNSSRMTLECDKVEFGLDNVLKETTNANTLYEIYTSSDAEKFDELFANEALCKKMYSNPEFVKASNSALKKIVEDKLDEEGLSQQDMAELTYLHMIFSEQEEMFDNPQNSFQLETINKTLNKNMHKRRSSVYKTPQLAFGSILNYGLFKKPNTRKRKAEAEVNRSATAAAAASALLLQVNTSLETSILTANTIKMCHKICDTYEMPGGATTALVAQITGALAGKTLASLVTKWFPGVGNVANASITYTLHEIQGRAIIEWCERNYDKIDEVSDWDAIAKTFNVLSGLNKIGPNPVDVLGELEL